MINVAILLLATIARQNLKTNTVLKILTIILIGLFLSLYFYFGGFSLPAFYNILARFLATADGTYIILTSGMYDFYQLPENLFTYIFDVVISRFCGITESVGQQIASFSYDLKYPDFGGPNDSVFNYLLLSNTLGKFLLIVIVAVGAFASGYLEKVFKNKISTETDIMVKFIYYPLYIMMPMLFQGVGTFFIEITRIYLLFIPLIFSIYFVRRVRVKKTRRDNTFLC
ncbi:hypothetical protein [Endozoicomonas atrinae]|uniref:hypothetical protein n=1 Tax=Endozoicomonas atrinae TaxID=1333660 RepID=UPI003B004418